MFINSLRTRWLNLANIALSRADRSIEDTFLLESLQPLLVVLDEDTFLLESLQPLLVVLDEDQKIDANTSPSSRERRVPSREEALYPLLEKEECLLEKKPFTLF